MTKPRRKLAVDLVRWIAAYGVIVIHLAPSSESGEKLGLFFSLFCVPYFMITSLYYFHDRLGKKRGWKDTFRAERILVPLLCWTLVYTSMHILKSVVTGSTFDFNFLAFFVFGGSAVQLYFLPLLLFFQVVLYGIYNVYTAVKARRMPWTGSITLLLSLCFGLYAELNGYFGWSMALEACLTYAALTLLLSKLLQLFNKRNTATLFVVSTVALILLEIAFLTGTVFSHSVYWLLPPVAGFALALACQKAPDFELGSKSKTVISTYYGIYLVHVVFIEALETVLPKLGFNLAPYSLSQKTIIGIIVLILSICAVLLIRRNRYTAFAFLGESRKS
ncbi:acyltransferase family protein [Rubellicoccus peritrichatus]|uniref:Acyltransferase family protein n=1 Tax=Rubellicoccus peritrichatus TaxID=3080537 RepID=A0AAQ3L704_9BACT|nr:acyltransferase family protein [Puniceicoccus sp. CR14]WOO40709.1 acyltransferase family protein [Puniceicoccus sp. CR14]